MSQTEIETDALANKIHDKVNSAIAPMAYVEATKHMQSVLFTLGIDLGDENFEETAHRFVKYLAEFLKPADINTALGSDFSIKHDAYHGMVAQKNIPYTAVCAHHLLPFLGHVAIGYIPSKRVVGLSKLTRLVEAISHVSPSLQEIHTDEIADALELVLEPRGVIVVVTAEHTCMSCRGVRAADVPTITSTVRGVYRDVPAAREEFFSLMHMSR